MLKGSCHCGNVKWTCAEALESVTACNCSLCSRYGALWAYGHLDHGITVTGSTSVYMRGSQRNGYNFCTNCGCMSYYLSNTLNEEGLRRIAVNTRLVSDPKAIEALPIDHFDGLDSFEDLPRDGRCVRDLWY